MTELKPCPFCGGEAHTRTNTVFDRNYKWTVECVTENCMAYQGCSFYRTEAEAIAAWNTRAERTCELIDFIEHVIMDEPDIAELSCGHDCMVFGKENIPNYCPNCGARVVS